MKEGTVNLEMRKQEAVNGQKGGEVVDSELVPNAPPPPGTTSSWLEKASSRTLKLSIFQ